MFLTNLTPITIDDCRLESSAEVLDPSRFRDNFRRLFQSLLAERIDGPSMVTCPPWAASLRSGFWFGWSRVGRREINARTVSIIRILALLTRIKSLRRSREPTHG